MWRTEKEGGRRGGKDECSDVSPAHSYSVQMQQSGLSLHTTASDDWPDHTHTHTFSHVTHTHHATRREALKAEQRYRDATGWQPLSKSTFPPLCSSFSLSVCCDCHSAARLSSFISQTLLCRCEMASVFSDWETFQTFPSVCHAHTSLSSRCLSFLFSACEWTQEQIPDVFAYWRRARPGCLYIWITALSV